MLCQRYPRDPRHSCNRLVGSSPDNGSEGGEVLPPSPFSWKHSGTASQVREVLDRAGYAEPTISELLETPEMPRPGQRRQALPLYLWRSRGDTPLEAMVRLFLLHQPVSLQAARRALAPMPLADWAECGLLAIGPTEVRAVVELAPYEGLVLAVDWAEAAVGDPVMGVAATSRVLAQLTVRRHAPRALDLGAGCGIQALLAARHSDHVSATELNPRAVHLARFNAELNGLCHVAFLPGDWFGPVHGQLFDLIVCNPPFVIAPSQRRLHTHSSRPSDHLCRDLIQAAPPFLRQDGYFQLAANWAHVTGQDWRDRLADWFAGIGCDAWVLHADAEAAPTYALARISEAGEDPDQATRLFDEWMAYYQREGIEGIGSGVITLRRSTRRPNWVRFDRFPGVTGQGGAAIEQGFALRDFLEANHSDRELLGARLCRADHLCWAPRYEPTAAGWSVVASQLRLTDGLAFLGNVDPPVAAFVARCNGEQPLGAALADIAVAEGQEAERLIPGFLRVVRRLVELGHLLPAKGEEKRPQTTVPSHGASADRAGPIGLS